MLDLSFPGGIISYVCMYKYICQYAPYDYAHSTYSSAETDMMLEKTRSGARKCSEDTRKS